MFSFCLCFLSFGVLHLLKIPLRATDFSSVYSPIPNIIFLDIFLLLLGNLYYIPTLSSELHTIGMFGFLITHPKLHSECVFLEAWVHIIILSASYITLILLLFLRSLYLLPVPGFIFHTIFILLKTSCQFL